MALYSFSNLSHESKELLISLALLNVERAERMLLREKDNLRYQEENYHIFNDGTIDITKKRIVNLILDCTKVKELIKEITL